MRYDHAMRPLHALVHVLDVALVLLLGLLGCRGTQAPDIGVSGFTDGPPPPPPPDEPKLPPAILVCPGETQCPCGQQPAADESGGNPEPCPGDLVCGPSFACTLWCTRDAECRSGVSGETCLGSRCAVPCDPAAEHGGCQAAGMPGAECMHVLGVNVCGYP